MKKLSKKYVIFLSIAVVIILGIIGVLSYAYYLKTSTQDTTNTYSTLTCLDVDFTSNTSSISLSNTYPMTDEEGLSTTPYNFTLTNNCSSYVVYYLLVSVLTTTDQLSSDYVKIELDGDKTISPSVLSTFNTYTTPDELSGSYSITQTYKIAQLTLDANGSQTFNFRMWLDGENDAVWSSDSVENKNMTVKISVVGVAQNKYTDNSGANAPELYSNMIPVYYSDTVSGWVYADTTKEWYDYDAKEWANAVVLVENPSTKYNVGDTISMSDVSQMYVWIPRYKYTIFNGGTGTSVASQLINVTFESGTESTGTVSCTDAVSGPTDGTTSQTCTDATNGSVTNGTSTYTHPAFTFGSTSLKGIWVGKFEVSGTTSSITIKPNVTSLRSVSVSGFYTAIKSISSQYSIDADTHMIKNMEWGAVAYLESSTYGLGTTDIGINNNSSYITGCGSTAGSSSSSTCNAYNTTNGKLASTTGNIYGVYDMSGGNYEYTMGDLTYNGTTIMSGYSSSANSGLTGELYDGSTFTSYSGISLPVSNYYDVYTFSTDTLVQSRGKLGDATKEILSTYGANQGGWYSDYSAYPFSGFSWFIRGGWNEDTNGAGIFCYSTGSGVLNNTRGSRAVITE